jgi:hypothetical protein
MGAKVKDWHLFYNYLNGPSSENARDWYLFHLLYNSKILAKRLGNFKKSLYLCHLYLLQL